LKCPLLLRCYRITNYRIVVDAQRAGVAFVHWEQTVDIVVSS